MVFFDSLLSAAPRLAPELEDRLQKLSEQAPPPTRNSHRKSRYVAVDVETSGPDARRDRVLSIGAVSVAGGRIALANCFDVVVKQSDAAINESTLIHRLGRERQLAGIEPPEALVRFLEYVGHAPLVAFRADFRRSMLDRALKEVVGVKSQSAWIDLARLLAALHPSSKSRTLDDWLQALRIGSIGRHDALADALATAQLLQVCLPLANERNLTCPQHLIDMRMARPWFGKRG